MKNNFGNYVLQTALVLAQGGTKGELTQNIQEAVSMLSNKKLKAKWSQILEGSANGVATLQRQRRASDAGEEEDSNDFACDIE